MNKKELKERVDAIIALEGDEKVEALEKLIVAEANSTKELEALKEKHKTEVEELQKDIEELQSQIDSAKSNPEELKRCQDTFKVGKKEYRFKVGILKFRFQGRMVTSEEAAKDKAIREELVKISFGGIEEMPAEK